VEVEIVSMKIITNKILQSNNPTRAFCSLLSLPSKIRFTLTAAAATTNTNTNPSRDFSSTTVNDVNDDKRFNRRSSRSNDSNINSNSNSSMDNARNRLAQAAMEQIPKYGWTQDAITVAAMEDPKLSVSMSGMLSPSELISWFMDDMNHQLRKNKEEQERRTRTNENENDDDVDVVFEAIQWRLNQVLPLVESGQWHHGMAMGLSTPLATQSQLHEFIEIISPENSTTAYHTALGAIFISTELFLLTDSSSLTNYSKTWSFLKQRLIELDTHQKEFGGNVDLAQLMLNNNPLSSVLSSPLSSLVTAATGNSIPIVASMAVGRSLLEGAASLVLPQSFRVLPQQPGGTKPSDYKY
jgi:rpsU-divergently transcribed protein